MTVRLRTFLKWIPIFLGILVLSTNAASYDNDHKNKAKDYGSEDNIKKPYTFGYEIEDGQGNLQHRHEESDGNGAKVGSYGYVDANGVYRKVDYIADKNGFRVKMSSNEPGVQGFNSPSVSMITKPYTGEGPTTPRTPVSDESAQVKNYNNLNVESSARTVSHHEPIHHKPVHHEPIHHELVRHEPVHHENVPHESIHKPRQPVVPRPSYRAYSPPLNPESASHIKEPEVSHKRSPIVWSPIHEESPKSMTRDAPYHSNQYTDNYARPINFAPVAKALSQYAAKPHNSIPYSQYDPMKREKELKEKQIIKAPYELDNQYQLQAPIQGKRNYDAKWIKHEKTPGRHLDEKPVHHEPYQIASRLSYPRDDLPSYSDHPTQLPAPPQKDLGPSYYERELPLPPPQTKYHDKLSEEQKPIHLPPPPVHFSNYPVQDSSNNLNQRHFDSYEAPLSSKSHFEPKRMRSNSEDHDLPLPPPPKSYQSSSQPAYPRKRPAAYPPRPEHYDNQPKGLNYPERFQTAYDTSIPQVVYDSTESSSVEHNSNNNRGVLNRPHDHERYHLNGDAPEGAYNTDEPIYINKLPDESKEELPSNYHPKSGSSYSDYDRYTVPKYSSEREVTPDDQAKPSPGNSHEVYSNFKSRLRGLFPLINRNKEDPYKDSSSLDDAAASQKINLLVIDPKKVKYSDLDGASGEDYHQKEDSSAPVYKD